MYLDDRPNGRVVSAEYNTKCKVVLMTDGELYKDYFIQVGQTSKNVMLAILKYMECDLNTICVGGDTLDLLVGHTGYSEQTIRDNLRKLHPMLEKTGVRGEYIVNPMFATKGNEKAVWDMYEEIEQRVNN